jgi:hypothetical protein
MRKPKQLERTGSSVRKTPVEPERLPVERGAIDPDVSALLTQISFVHGPCDLLARYAAVAEQELHQLGLRLKVSTDFHRLFALSEQHRDSWPTLSPIFNRKLNALADHMPS